MEHFEDLIIRKGSKRALTAIYDVIGLSSGTHWATTKYDGSPVIVFGRDGLGQFVMNDKNRFFAKTYNGKAPSKARLRETILRRKSDEPQQRYAALMESAFEVLSESLSTDFRGLFFAELLWFPNTTKWDGQGRTCKPNLVTYDIRELAAKSAEIGLVIHTLDRDGKEQKLVNSEVQCFDSRAFVVTPERVNDLSQPDVETRLLEAAAVIRAHYYHFDSFVKDYPSIAKALYSYNCRETKFTKASSKKFIREYAKDLDKASKETLEKLCAIINTLNSIKNDVVDYLEAARVLQGHFHQSIDGRPGGEGFVMESEKPFKLVKRSFRKR